MNSIQLKYNESLKKLDFAGKWLDKNNNHVSRDKALLKFQALLKIHADIFQELIFDNIEFDRYNIKEGFYEYEIQENTLF